MLFFNPPINKTPNVTGYQISSPTNFFFNVPTQLRSPNLQFPVSWQTTVVLDSPSTTSESQVKRKASPYRLFERSYVKLPSESCFAEDPAGIVGTPHDNTEMGNIDISHLKCLFKIQILLQTSYLYRLLITKRLL